MKIVFNGGKGCIYTDLPRDLNDLGSKFYATGDLLKITLVGRNPSLKYCTTEQQIEIMLQERTLQKTGYGFYLRRVRCVE